MTEPAISHHRNPTPPPAAKTPKRLPPLTVELLVNLTLLALGALIVAVASALLFAGIIDSPLASWYLTALLLGDVAIFVVFGHWLLRRVVVRPIADAAAAAEAIAAGDLERRIPPGSTAEFDALAQSLNRMTTTLLAHEAHMVRTEKLASVGRLAAGIAHEIGNPLGALNGYAHLLRSSTRDTSAREAVSGVER